jgi:hypothetical protein
LLLSPGPVILKFSQFILFFSLPLARNSFSPGHTAEALHLACRSTGARVGARAARGKRAAGHGGIAASQSGGQAENGEMLAAYDAEECGPRSAKASGYAKRQFPPLHHLGSLFQSHQRVLQIRAITANPSWTKCSLCKGSSGGPPASEAVHPSAPGSGPLPHPNGRACELLRGDGRMGRGFVGRLMNSERGVLFNLDKSSISRYSYSFF